LSPQPIEEKSAYASQTRVGENNNDETARGENHQITADQRERCDSVGLDRLMGRPLTGKEAV